MKEYCNKNFPPIYRLKEREAFTRMNECMFIMCVFLWTLYVTISVLEEYFGFLWTQGDVLVPSSAWFLETKVTLRYSQISEHYITKYKMKCTLFFKQYGKTHFLSEIFPLAKILSLCSCQTLLCYYAWEKMTTHIHLKMKLIPVV